MYWHLFLLSELQVVYLSQFDVEGSQLLNHMNLISKFVGAIVNFGEPP